jgi:hypothetical protein
VVVGLSVGQLIGVVHSELSSIGITFAEWTVNKPLAFADGAIFLMDPDHAVDAKMLPHRRLTVAQLTVPTDAHFDVKVGVLQGRSVASPGDCGHWAEESSQQEPHCTRGSRDWAASNLVWKIRGSGH